MARTYTFGRQQAEALVDLLEDNADYQLHDQTALEMAAELRTLFGMCTREQQQRQLANMHLNNFKGFKAQVALPPKFYEGNFSDAFRPPERAGEG